MNAVVKEAPQPLRIDLGAGKNPKPGFVGIDRIDFKNGSLICDIGTERWPWEDSSVDEAHCHHVFEHLTNLNGKCERVHFLNELHRVLKPSAGCLLTIPHWASQRYYGDPTHCEPFSEFGFYYLSREWRKVNAPHTDIEFNPKGYTCDLECTWGYSMHPSMQVRSADYQQHAMQWWLEARQDMVATLKAKK